MAQRLPVVRHLGQLLRHVQEGEASEAPGVGGEKSGGQGAALDPHDGEDGDDLGKRAAAEAGEVVNDGGAGCWHGGDSFLLPPKGGLFTCPCGAGGFFSSERGRRFPALTGGAAWQPAMAGSLHPPFSIGRGRCPRRPAPPGPTLLPADHETRPGTKRFRPGRRSPPPSARPGRPLHAWRA